MICKNFGGLNGAQNSGVVEHAHIHSPLERHTREPLDLPPRGIRERPTRIFRAGESLTVPN